MAFRTWGRLPLTALGVSMLAGAGQLGIAYGFGVVRLDGAFADGSVNRWPAQLAWVGWFAAIAAVAGAVVTERLARRDGSPGGISEQLAVAGVAALGATVVAPLCMQPARTAELGGTVDPVWAVGICAMLGALVGAGAAMVVLLRPPFGWNIALTAAVIWLLALVSVAPTVASTGPLRTVRLGVLEPSWLDPAAAQRLAMLVLPTIALLAGAATGALARRRGHLAPIGGAAGLAGPVLLAFAYLTAGPGDASDRYQLAPYYGALIAVAAGALGSTAATVLRRPTPAPDTDAIEPTDILQPLPASPATPVAAAATGSNLAAPAADGTADQPGRIAPMSESPGAGSLAPAHWDWPAASGLTPAPVRSGRTVPRHSAPDDRGAPVAPATPDEGIPPVAPATPDDRVPPAGAAAGTTEHEPVRPVRPTAATAAPDDPIPTAETATPDVAVAEPAASIAEIDGRAERGTRDADELTRNLPAPMLPPGRRTSAIDVLAAGRPAAEPKPPAPAATPADATPSRRRERISEPARKAAGVASATPGEESPAAPAESAPPVAGRSARPAEPAPASSRAEQRGGEPSKGDRPDRKAAVTRGMAASGPATAGASATPAPAPAAGDRPSDSATPQPGDAEPGTAPTPRGGRRSRRGTSGAKGAAGLIPTTPATSRPERAGAATAPDRTDASATTQQERTGVPASARQERTDRPDGIDAPTPADQSTPAQTEVLPPARPDQAEAPAEHPVGQPEDGTPAAPRGRSKRGRKSPAAAPAPTTEPVGTTPAEPAAEVDVPARAQVTPVPRDPAAAEPAGVAKAGTPGSPAPDTSTDGRSRSYLFADEPAGPGPLDPPASPRPRVPMFEDVTDRPDDDRPARPAAAAPNWPVTPRATAAPGEAGPSGGPESSVAPADEAETPPAPRPRHRALPDLARPNWDAFPNARPATPVGPDASPAGGRHAGPVDPAATAADPAEEADEPGGGKSKQRRGLFRRNRAKGGDVPEPDRESGQLAQDEEYVDWVAGLASDDDAGDIRALRTGRHHRD
ncbi:hypothetical protein Q2K19_14900 [Micromonospora soli]|uniref:hypothetical protein n=1 Tax=Micromonospora sp. NBRC 110009 TaxID=3061627 RepID=UPI0026728176|nr:hypothetical protein [Micromonospora sp. NBRC 110009]WKU01662.1 hypothetical protein Q2K19_14900 [Micromonospora sp. NBRC 110009]